MVSAATIDVGAPVEAQAFHLNHYHVDGNFISAIIRFERSGGSTGLARVDFATCVTPWIRLF